MKKIIYKTSNLFSLKNYDDSNLNCTSMLYPSLYSIRSAIIGAIITTDGIDKAKELFETIKNAKLKVCFPNKYNVNGIVQKRYSNSSYLGKCNVEEYDTLSNSSKAKYYYVLDRDNLVKCNWKKTMGFREYICLDEISFYIDDNIPDVYFKNIDWLGTSESMVYLSEIRYEDNMDNVLIKWNGTDRKDTYIQHDWDRSIKFDNIYMYSNNYKHHHETYMCTIENTKSIC